MNFKKQVIAGLFLTLLFSCNQIQEDKNAGSSVANWKELNSDVGKFKVLFPDYELKQKEEVFEIDGQEKTVYSYGLNFQHIEDEHENIAYYFDYSLWPELETEDAINSKFNDQVEYLLTATNGEMLYNKKYTYNNYNGREIYFSVDGKDVMVLGRLIFANGIFYKIYVVSTKGQLFNNSMKIFLDSFEITT